ncbi:MAG: Threonylcarbamoyladenosine tRNA methylthiotransferase MtaB [Deltaproteobacteria bacterium ADurb.Bin510]|nr:MAG: Threonylcarbamoyladenosine tRNA methylthiotransferase MtaB [Deltaproteobacteria bacterium ADurb.Bin510]
MAVLPEYLGLEPFPTVRGFSGHRRAFVKVQSGCDNFCTYCIVPFARGLPVSRPQVEIIDEINALSAAGYREAVLCGINLGLYEGGITKLLKDLLAATDMPRLRLSSLEPWTVDEAFCELFAAELRICRHLHLPLQSGCDAILAAMGRPYRRAYYRDLLLRLNQAAPLAALGTDVMVGFPGEDEAAFEDGLAFLTDLPLAYLHVFPYSRRPGTPAAGFAAQVPEIVKKQRAARLRDLSESKRLSFEQACSGSTAELLVSRSVAGVSWGTTSNYLKLKVAAELNPYDVYPVRVLGQRAGSLWGEVLTPGALRQVD